MRYAAHHTRADAFAVWGAGGHGKVVADLVRALGFQVAGFVDDAAPSPSARVMTRVDAREGATALLLESEVTPATLLLAFTRAHRRYPDGVDALALGIGANAPRLARFQALGKHAVPTLVHPTACVSSSARVGRGSVAFASVIINAGAIVGDAVIINSGAIVEHDCIVEDGAHVSPHATLCGAVRVGKCAWVGAGATVIQGITIGAGAIVGAGAVVVRDVPAHVTVVGNPGRIIRRDEHQQEHV